MNPDPQREAALFQAAAQLTGPARATFLDGACHGNPALRQRLEALLAANDSKDSFLEPEAPKPDREPAKTMKLEIADAPDEAVGQKIGRYKILERVGEGGCGVVYVAEQTEPVRRRVALKVIKLGMDTKQVVARFEAERQALAMMDHPNIAKVLDAGTTETGRPFFVMELVRGIRITDYCDQANLPTTERLDLFIQVCHAIQHAHQKGIIHRDIKPSNILVTLHDGVPVPKVIDFGIAKATEGRLTDNTVYTQLHQFIGTPAYMSPEQAEMSGLDIDTRSDIYSLGVLLYELLAGSTPFDGKDLVSMGIDAMRKIIREQEPVRPSTRFATLKGEDLTTTAKRRSAEAPKLINLLKGDLDWIVMKCLEKDRTRRYETANGLAADLKRHLNNEPVLACPPSTAYRFQKSFRRNKLVFTAATAVAAALVFGILVSVWQAVRATSAKRDALVARQQAETNEQKAVVAQASEAKLRERAEADEKKAETEAARSAQVAQFMTDMLKGVGPSVALGRDTKLLREILDQTAARLDTLKAQPEVESDLRLTLGGVYRDLGDYPKAEAMFQQALAIRKKLHGEKSLPVASVLDQLGQVLHRTGKSGEAEAAYRQALAIREELSGHESLEVASSLNHLGSLLRNVSKRDEAEAKLREGLALRRRLLPPDSPEIANSLSDLGIVLGAQGKTNEAEPLHREALALRRKIFPPDHPQIADSLMQLGATLDLQGNYAEAETNILAALAIQQKVLGDHRDTANTLSRLGSLLVKEKRLPEAEQRFREELAMRNKVFGESAVLSDKLVDVLQKEGKLAELVKLQHDDLARWNHGSSTNLPPLKMADTLVASGKALFAAGKPDEAEAAYRDALAITQSHLGDKAGAGLLKSLGDHLGAARKDDRKVVAYRELMDLQIKTFGRESTNAVDAMFRVGQNLSWQRHSAEAEVILREVVAIARKLGTNDNNALGNSLGELGAALQQQGKLPEAEAAYREAVAYPMQANYLNWARNDLSSLLVKEKRFAEAETQYRAAVEYWKIQQATWPAFCWSVDNLADCLKAQGKNAETEAVFREALASVHPGSREGDQAAVRWREKLQLLSEGKPAEAKDLNLDTAKSGNADILNKGTPELATSADLETRDGSNAVVVTENAVALQREELARWKHDSSTNLPPLKMADTLVATGKALFAAGKPDEAETAYRDAFEIRRSYLGADQDPGLLKSLADRLRKAGKHARAEAARREILDLEIKLHGRESTNAAIAMSGVVMELNSQGKYSEAETLGRETRAVQKKLKVNDSFVGATLELLGVALQEQGKLVEAEACFREAITNANTRPDTDYWARGHLGDVLMQQSRFAEAETQFRARVEHWNKQQATQPGWAWSVDSLANALQAQRKNAEAEKLLRDESGQRQKNFGDGDQLVARWRGSLTRLLSSEGKFVEAKALMVESLKTGSPDTLNSVAWDFATSPEPEMRDGSNAVIFAEKAVAATSRTNAQFLDTLAAAYAEVRQFDKAVAAEQEVISLLPKGNTNNSSALMLSLYQSSTPYRDHGALAENALSLLQAGKFAEAEPVARECLALREKLIPDSWYRFNAESLLGGSLLGQKKYADAEPLLLAGYEGLKQREEKIPAAGKSRPREALQRLVQLYEETNRPDQAAKLKKELESSNPPASK